MIGVTGLDGDYAAALASLRGQRPLFVYLHRQGGAWDVIEATSIPSGEVLSQLGVPDSITLADDAYSIIDLALARQQDTRGDGLNGYAASKVAPAQSEQLDDVTAFYKREGGAWAWLTGGTALPREQLSEMEVPEALWEASSDMHGPA